MGIKVGMSFDEIEEHIELSKGWGTFLNKWALDTSIKTELNMLLILSSLMTRSGVCFASNEYLAKTLNINTSQVSKKLKKLEQSGYLKIEYERRGCEITKREIRFTNQNDPRIKLGYHDCQKEESYDCQKEESTIVKNAKENKITSSSNSISVKNEKFDEFWKIYPRHKSKMTAIKIFNKHIQNGIDAQEIINGVKKYVSEIKKKKTEEQYIKHPTTWLNQMCWEDDYEVIEQSENIIEEPSRYKTYEQLIEEQRRGLENIRKLTGG